MFLSLISNQFGINIGLPAPNMILYTIFQIRQMLEKNEMTVLREILVLHKTKINRIQRQQIRESSGILPIEWVERRREWDERVTRISKNSIAAGRGSPDVRKSENNLFSMEPWAAAKKVLS